MDATLLWSLWQDLLNRFRWAFSTPGWHHLVEWITGLALNCEEHTITQSLVALDRTDDGKAIETFAETGAWNPQIVDWTLADLTDTAPGQLWLGYRVWYVDAPKVHRNRQHV